MNASLQEYLSRRSEIGPEVRPGLGACVVWTKGKTLKGYGQAHFGHKQYAHRFAYEAYIGPIPDGLCVLHRCDNPACINPEHLWLGTNADNTADMMAKGRQAPRYVLSAIMKQRASRGADHWLRRIPKDEICERHGACLWPESRPRGQANGKHTKPESRTPGERNGSAKLTAAQVIAIRSDVRRYADVAEAYGMSRTMISNIKTRKNWAHI